MNGQLLHSHGEAVTDERDTLSGKFLRGGRAAA